MFRPEFVKPGFVVCLVGLAICATTLIPEVYERFAITPVLLGSMVYVPGAFTVFFGSRGPDRNKAYNMVRMVRLGFIVVIVILYAKLMGR